MCERKRVCVCMCYACRKKYNFAYEFFQFENNKHTFHLLSQLTKKKSLNFNIDFRYIKYKIRDCVCSAIKKKWGVFVALCFKISKHDLTSNFFPRVVSLYANAISENCAHWETRRVRYLLSVAVALCVFLSFFFLQIVSTMFWANVSICKKTHKFMHIIFRFMVMHWYCCCEMVVLLDDCRLRYCRYAALMRCVTFFITFNSILSSFLLLRQCDLGVHINIHCVLFSNGQMALIKSLER